MELSNNDILKDKWIYFRYELPHFKPNDMDDEEFFKKSEELKINILEICTGQMMISDSQEMGFFSKLYAYKNSTNKNLSATLLHIEENEYAIIIRFNEKTKEIENEHKETTLRYIPPNEERNYRFSPEQYIKFMPINLKIEYGLLVVLKYKQLEIFDKEGRTVILFEYDKDNNPLITETDGIGYFTYPFEKRFELYLKYPAIEKKIFGKWKFEDFIKWIYTKKEKSDYDKKFCEDIEMIMNKK